MRNINRRNRIILILKSLNEPASAREIVDLWMGHSADYKYNGGGHRSLLKKPPSARAVGLLMRSIPGVGKDINGRYYLIDRDVG